MMRFLEGLMDFLFSGFLVGGYFSGLLGEEKKKEH
jgi:hypothetical protein